MLMPLGLFFKSPFPDSLSLWQCWCRQLKESVNVTFPAGHYFSTGSAKCQHQQRQLPHPPKKLLGYLCLKATVMYFCRIPPIYQQITTIISHWPYTNPQMQQSLWICSCFPRYFTHNCIQERQQIPRCHFFLILSHIGKKKGRKWDVSLGWRSFSSLAKQLADRNHRPEVRWKHKTLPPNIDRVQEVNHYLVFLDARCWRQLYFHLSNLPKNPKHTSVSRKAMIGCWLQSSKLAHPLFPFRTKNQSGIGKWKG